MLQKRVMPDRREKVWEVDVDVLRRLLPKFTWLKNERLLARDLAEMGQYLPHWVLTVGDHSKPYRSKCCNDNVAPIEGELRCILCHGAVKGAVSSLQWIGLLPVNLEGRDKAMGKIFKARSEGRLNYPVIEPNGQRHLLVPVVVDYPVNWPQAPPQGHYADKQLLDALKISYGHNTHVVGERTMCLYQSMTWNDNNTIMHVIANRMAPHAFALMRIANDEQSIGYFTNSYQDPYYDR